MRLFLRRRPVGAALTLALSTSLLLSACVNLAPDYERPAAPVSAAWPAASAAPPAAAASDVTDMGWRNFLLDERLRRVVELSLANSRDMRIALLDVEQARAQYRVQDATRWPTVGASAGVTRSYGGGVATNSANVSVGLGSYELDLFGRVRNADDRALQSYLATTEGARAARITLVSAVAQAWLALAADGETLRLTEHTLATQEHSLDLTTRMHALGAIKGLPVTQADASVQSSRGAAAQQRTQIQLDRNALVLLVGHDVPEDLLPVDAMPVDTAVLVGVPVDLPARVLQERPDVLQAERGLREAQIDIGTARAAFFPTITLTGSAGTASVGLGGLFKSGSGSWSFGPSITLPIFDGGANSARLDSARQAREIALATYEKAVQGAFREVADALAVRATLAERIAAQQAQTRASAAALRYAEALFRQGGSSYLEVLDAQRGLYGSQQAEISLNLAEQDNRITLYKALGGGWKESN